MEQRILTALKSHKKLGLTRRAIAKRLGVKKGSRVAFEAALEALLGQDKLLMRGDRFLPVDAGQVFPGEVVKIAASFGFARPDGWERDVFVPGKYLMGAIPGDKVSLRVSDAGRKDGLQEGEVMRIVELSQRPFPGVLTLEDGVYVVTPDIGMRLPLPVVRGGLWDAKPGDKVMATVAHRGQHHSDHTVQVAQALGSSGDPAVCALAILARLDVPTVFPAEALEQAQSIASLEGIHPKELVARLDLRGEVIFTIDGADSKDLDDAVSLNRTGSGWELGVHIADVSHYVTAGCPLDAEALLRGTSVYYANRVVPMLPHELSNGICSLNPGEDRLAFSAFISLDESGNRTSYRFAKTVIHSRVKGIYAELNELVAGSGDDELRAKYAGVWEKVLQMRQLASLLMQKRLDAGKMVLGSSESKIIVGEDGAVADITTRERGFFEELIEEFMLQANEAAASFAQEKGLPFVFRVHEDPNPEKLDQLYELLTRLNISFERPDSDDLSSGLSQILRQVQGSTYADVVNVLVLRSMAKAKYSPGNSGHFGLKLDNYAHFTSPIRRYPDLAIHRILSSVLGGIKPENLHKRYAPFAARAAERGTMREIAAVTAERDCEDCYKASYMRNFLGQELGGIVSGCTGRGLFVRLPNSCEGMVRRDDFPPGDWEFDGVIDFTEEASGKRIRLGDQVRVRVLAAEVSSGRVDFALTDS